LDAITWQQRRGTLDDEAIFGPMRSFRCVCSKYSGLKYNRIICDECGVKITKRSARRRRCAHINLETGLPHPLDRSAPPVVAIPVVPASFVESPEGLILAELYDELARLAPEPRTDDIAGCYERLLYHLAMPTIVAHNWNLRDRRMLANGMGLEKR
jgi:hypothetical protein